ncbi:metal-dependent transcriptional regulator [Candidatus Thorarchaeota archaeon]|jgi:DtxR family Mn-dependent transcriptional regulator|nr:MAG: metal-dependent transcriptional regulator [Candidatus Thorarchaeota archaeon]
MTLSDAMEMYVKTIHRLELKHGSASVSAIAEAMDVKAPSVTVALRKLAELDMVDYERYKTVNLTETGRRIALELEKTYRVLKEFFMLLGIDEEIAEQDACKIEHMINPQTFERILVFVESSKK